MTAIHDLEETNARLRSTVDKQATEILRLNRQVDVLLSTLRQYETAMEEK